jgi:hypothetical protein
MATKTEKPHYATRDFSDGGTNRQFQRGAVIEADPGEIANYAAAGLATIEKPKASDPEPAAPAA